MTEESKEEKVSIITLFFGRVKHPIIGTFITAFLIYNYDAFILLTYGISNGYPKDSISEFREFFSKNLGNDRIKIPLYIMAAYAFGLPILDALYAGFLKTVDSLKKDCLEWASRIEKKIHIEKLEIELVSERTRREQAEKKLGKIKDICLSLDINKSKIMIGKSLELLDLEEIVSLNKSTHLLERLSPRNKDLIVGRILYKIDEKILVVSMKCGVELEKANTFDQLVYWDLIERKLKYSKNTSNAIPNSIRLGILKKDKDKPIFENEFNLPDRPKLSLAYERVVTEDFSNL